MSIVKTIIPALVGFILIIGIGITAVPFVFAERVKPGTYIGEKHFGGFLSQNIPAVLEQYEQDIAQQSVEIQIREQIHTYTLHELGVVLDTVSTSTVLQDHSWFDTVRGQNRAKPVVTIDESKLHALIARDFSSILQVPRNATLRFSPTGAIEIVSSQIGEGINTAQLVDSIAETIAYSRWNTVLNPDIVTLEPRLVEKDLIQSRELATKLLQDGLTLFFDNREWKVLPFTLRRMMVFSDQGVVQLKPEEVQAYLTTTIAPEVDQISQNARFEIIDGKVSQFGVSQAGYHLDPIESTVTINQALQNQQQRSSLVVHVTEPEIRTSSDIESLGLTTLLAKGESDFAGSPANRIHNVTVGTVRYHGVLIPPDTEFSFNALLGPVTAAAGFKPELVIKHNVTIPEFGGGLCQVSTTIFRAAVQAGLPITMRRNHAYVVKYYGKPGFDATIYPPYTDLRFKNDTPNYILIQTKLEGTHLSMEFWGTPDGREVAVEGPVTYDRKPDGSMRAVVKQIVKKDGQIQREDAFYSRYRSPALFPKVAP